MSRLESAPVYLRNKLLTNETEHLSRAQETERSKFMRGKAREAWLNGQGLYDVTHLAEFHLFTFLPRQARLPDADSSSWVAKRFLDGAVDAAIIGDDSPDYIGKVVLHAPASATAPYLDWGACYVGVLRPLARDIHALSFKP